jgi:putative membrane-bound dehydrogenase-like protein
MTHIQVPPGFRLELFASEPDIVKPIAMTWDERGRLWIAETIDYPNDIHPGRPGRDRIKILEDTNGDGKADKFTVFADSLNIPTSLVFTNGGVLVSHMPSFIFLKDTNGDDKADVRQEVLGGWGYGDTHAGPSNLRYGFDNRIWGAVGYSNHITVGPEGDSSRFGQAIYRFRPGTYDSLEHVASFSNNTWGPRLLRVERRVRLDGEQHARDVRRRPASLPAGSEGAAAAPPGARRSTDTTPWRRSRSRSARWTCSAVSPPRRDSISTRRGAIHASTGTTSHS